MIWLGIALVICAIAILAGRAYGLHIDAYGDLCPVTGRTHDYKVENGGDGTPSHFYTYTCSFCGKQFQI